MKSQRIITVTTILFSLFFMYACSLTPKTNNFQDSPSSPPLATQISSATSTALPVPLPIATTNTDPVLTTEIIESNIEGYSNNQLREIWASEALSDEIGTNVQSVVGAADAFECNNRYESWYNDEPENSPNEYILNLKYDYALVPTDIIIYFTSEPGGMIRVELLDSRSGLGTEIYNGVIDTEHKCPGEMVIPTDTNLKVDTVILAFSNSGPPAHIDAVKLIGHLPNFLDIPVYWRIHIPADHMADPDSDFPGGLVTDEYGNIFLANGRNGLARYDVEGNLLKNYSVPDLSNIRDVASDNQGRIIITDLTYKWYVTFDQDGIQVDAGGEDFGWNGPREIAIHPATGYIYLLDETDEFSRIRVYSPETNTLVRDINLESIGLQMHKGLVFDPEGFLYTIDQMQALILKIDVDTGEVVDFLGYQFLNSVSPSDLAIDDAGNIYVLLNASPEDSAIYILDHNGFLTNRLGNLTYDGINWMEGVFFFPVSISVSPDGRFLSVCEVGYLSTYLLEFEN